MNNINLSIFELLKIGPGPSSSHTIGPMSAGMDFRKRAMQLPLPELNTATGIKITLLGSLSATGKGHGTDRAVAAGLMGWSPESIDADRFLSLLSEPDPEAVMELAGHIIVLHPKDIIYGPVAHKHPYSNTLTLTLLARDKPLLKQTYYSIGGGFIQWDGYQTPERGIPRHSYQNMAQLLKITAQKNLSLADVILDNEADITGSSRQNILTGLDRILKVMDESVTRGLETRGVLPGPVGLSRKAADLYSRIPRLPALADRMLLELNAFALAGAEENAGGGIVVTAPTMGSAGVIPAVLRHLRIRRRLSNQKLCLCLLTAAAIGFIVKHNASIAGAEVGCQGEIGVASAMAAGMFCTAGDFKPEVAASAAEIALEHHLGLTCDPVMGLVQIPCIERNTMGAIKAYNAFLLASAGDVRQQKVAFDPVVRVMLETGRDMSKKYKETARGGLAVNLANC